CRAEVHNFRSEYDQAEELLTEALNLASELRDGLMRQGSLFMLGMTQGNLGKVSDALRTFNEGLKMAERNDNYFYLSRLPNCLGWIHNELQYFNRAREHNQRGAEIAHQGQILEAEANSLINLGYDYAHTGESDKPPAVFREVEAIFARDDWMRWRYNIRLQAGRAEYHLAQGNLEQAREYAERLLETATH